MCGREECWKDGSSHALGECSFFKTIGLQMTTNSLKKMHNLVVQLSISVLRCIVLKEWKPRNWKKMMKLELKYSDLISRCQQEHSYKEAAVDLVYTWIEKQNSLIPRDCIVKLCDMFHLLNSFRMFSNRLGHPQRGSMVLNFHCNMIAMHLTVSSLSFAELVFICQ